MLTTIYFWRYIHLEERISLASAYENLYLHILQQFIPILTVCGCFTVLLGLTWYKSFLIEHMLLIYIPYEHAEKYGINI